MNIEDKTDIINNASKLYWASCRRGMLELDVLLGNFLREVYPHLSLADKIQFVRLINCKDPDIFAWLMGERGPDDAGLLAIITMIKKHARPDL
jgi:antitoxin CptB